LSKEYSSQASQSWLAMGGSISRPAVVASSRNLNSSKETQRSKVLDYRKRHDSTGSLPGMLQVSTEYTCLLKKNTCTFQLRKQFGYRLRVKSVG